MNELAIFAGAGGGILGSKLLGHRMIGYVEINEYCQKIIRQRIDDGILDEAPIFGDIRAFNDSGYAGAYKGMVDVISGGFPCQDISCAGTGKGLSGERSGLWFEMEKIIRLVGPQYVFIENSPILLVRGFEHVIGGLSKMGYSCAWGIVSAADIGAPHIRKRIWILAHSNSTRKPQQARNVKKRRMGVKLGGEDVAYAQLSERRTKRSWRCGMAGDDSLQKREENPSRVRVNGSEIPDTGEQGFSTSKQEDVQGTWRWQKRRAITECDWWAVEPALGRMAHGVANRVDRLKAIGNGQVPAVAATAFRILQSKLAT